MALNRFLKYINIFIGLLVLAALVAGYWMFYRPLPRTSGQIEAPLDSPASVVRDDLGVALIEAATEEDALLLQGFVTAQDRMLQLDLARRRAAGELAEILGTPLVESDRVARQLGIAVVAEQHARTLRPADRAALAAYARGVNFYLELNQDRLPAEFRLLDYEPRPWRIADSVAIGMQMSRTLSEVWPDDAQRQNFLQAGDAEKIRRLFPMRSGLEGQPGSNAWALAGKRTASGKPLLANDPHLPFTVPSVWHQVRLRTPTLNVAGVAVVGLPGVLIGHNDQIAWGITYLPFDVQDLYVERLDVRTGQYAYRGRVLQASGRPEAILVKDAAAVNLTVWNTIHGPVVISQGATQLALRWTANEAGGFHYPFLDINRAGNWDEFRGALRELAAPPQNFVYADVEGNIGYQAAGRLPIRRFDGRFPVDGASGGFEWAGYIPFDELPSEFNPESGMIVSANQNPFPEDYPHPVQGKFSPGYRFQRIQALLESDDGWTPEKTGAVQNDVYDAILRSLGRQAVRALEDRGISTGELKAASELLTRWDGEMREDAAAPLVATLLFQQLRRAIAEKASPGAGRSYANQMGPAVVNQLLEERPQDWFGDYDQLLLRCLVDAIEAGKRMQGDEIAGWRYGLHHQLRLSAGVVERLPVVGQYFRFDPIPMDGSPNTVKQTKGELGPSLRFILDAADWESSLAVLPPGQSGHPLSGNFRNQAEAYWAGEYFPFSFQQVTGMARLKFRPAR